MSAAKQIVHLLGFGHAACLKPGPPGNWEPGHAWSGDWKDVTCPECLLGREPVKSYTISSDGQSITCLCCKRTSFHPEDVKNRWCRCWGVSHDMIWEPSRRAWMSLTPPPLD